MLTRQFFRAIPAASPAFLDHPTYSSPPPAEIPRAAAAPAPFGVGRCLSELLPRSSGKSSQRAAL